MNGRQRPGPLREATRCAEARRVALGAWRDESIGRSYALDLMGIEPRALTEGHLAFADTVRTVNASSLAAADLYLADADMVALIDAAAPSMPDQTLEETDPLSRHGWLWLTDPLRDRTGVPPEVPIRALSWSTLGPASPLLDRWETPAESDRGAVLIHAYCDTLAYAQGRASLDGTRPDQVSLAPGAPGLIPSASSMWAYGAPIDTAFGRTLDELSAESGYDITQADPGFYQRVLAAFWTLARQPLTETTETPAGARPDRKRAARAGVTDPSAPVRVLRLRHRGAAGGAREGDSGRHVTVRFAVRGHWRNQWLPSTQTHRQQYIAPHLRGPADAPLLSGERVFLAQGPVGGQPEGNRG